MKRISISSQKGGAGKTVITALIANSLSIDYCKKVLVIDADPQLSFYDIRERDKAEIETVPYDVIKMPVTNVADYLDELSETEPYDIILIDLPGRMDDVNLVRVIQELDCILVPLVADQTDLFSTIDYIEMLNSVLKKLSDYGIPPKKVYGFNNKAEGAIEERSLGIYCEDIGLPMLGSKISNRKIYARFTTYTSYISQQGYKFNQSRVEVKQFIEEVVEKLELQ